MIFVGINPANGLGVIFPASCKPRSLIILWQHSSENEKSRSQRIVHCLLEWHEIETPVVNEISHKVTIVRYSPLHCCGARQLLSSCHLAVLRHLLTLDNFGGFERGQLPGSLQRKRGWAQARVCKLALLGLHAHNQGSGLACLEEQGL